MQRRRGTGFRPVLQPCCVAQQQAGRFQKTGLGARRGGAAARSFEGRETQRPSFMRPFLSKEPLIGGGSRFGETGGDGMKSSPPPQKYPEMSVCVRDEPHGPNSYARLRVPFILCTGGPDVIRKEAWSFYRTISGVRLYWELEETKGPKGRARHGLLSRLFSG